MVAAKFAAEYSTVIIAGLVIAFGATAHTAVQIKQARENGVVFGVVDMVIALIISGFSGVMFGLVASYAFTDMRIIYACSGAGALLGLKGVDAMANRLLETLTKRASGE